jgi:HTH-type transcriptional regulator / antitoxin HigA
MAVALKRAKRPSASHPKINPAAYGRLLARTLPARIESPQANEIMIAELDRLDRLPHRTPEEDRLMDLLIVLIEEFEERAYPLRKNTPRESLQALMEFRGLRQRDLVDVFGSRAGVSEALSGKAAISKSVARKLADFFHVPVDIFI